MTEPGEALAEVLGALEKLEIPYFIGGSIASSVHGAVRATKDVNVIHHASLPRGVGPIRQHRPKIASSRSSSGSPEATGFPSSNGKM